MRAFERELRRNRPEETETGFYIWPPVNDDER
jgi:hypothetical protein